MAIWKVEIYRGSVEGKTVHAVGERGGYMAWRYPLCGTFGLTRFLAEDDPEAVNCERCQRLLARMKAA
jgi:hypothetical protein